MNAPFNNWILPTKVTGKTKKASSVKFEDENMPPAVELASRETQRTGRLISKDTVIQNLMYRDDNFARQKRAELRAIREQLNKEKINEDRTTAPQPEQAHS